MRDFRLHSMPLIVFCACFPMQRLWAQDSSGGSREIFIPTTCRVSIENKTTTNLTIEVSYFSDKPDDSLDAASQKSAHAVLITPSNCFVPLHVWINAGNYETEITRQVSVVNTFAVGGQPGRQTLTFYIMQSDISGSPVSGPRQSSAPRNQDTEQAEAERRAKQEADARAAKIAAALAAQREAQKRAKQETDEKAESMRQITQAAIDGIKQQSDAIHAKLEASRLAASTLSSGEIFSQIDQSLLNTDRGTNFVRILNKGGRPTQVTVWTTDCMNVEVARCGTIFTNITVSPNSDAGFWINRQNSNQPWQYKVHCNVSQGSHAFCDATGGGTATGGQGQSPPAYQGLTQWQCRAGGGTNCDALRR